MFNLYFYNLHLYYFEPLENKAFITMHETKIPTVEVCVGIV